MTDHLHALAMRTKAAELMGEYHWQRYADKKDGGKLSSPAVFTSHTHQHVTAAILALPLESDHAALLAEAVKLPEIAALVSAATEINARLRALMQVSILNDKWVGAAKDLDDAIYEIVGLETP